MTFCLIIWSDHKICFTKLMSTILFVSNNIYHLFSFYSLESAVLEEKVKLFFYKQKYINNRAFEILESLKRNIYKDTFSYISIWFFLKYQIYHHFKWFPIRVCCMVCDNRIRVGSPKWYTTKTILCSHMSVIVTVSANLMLESVIFFALF